MKLYEKFLIRMESDNGCDNEKLAIYLQKIAEKYQAEQLNIHDVSNRYSIEDIEKRIESWGLYKVEKENIERFLNGC